MVPAPEVLLLLFLQLDVLLVAVVEAQTLGFHLFLNHVLYLADLLLLVLVELEPAAHYVPVSYLTRLALLHLREVGLAQFYEIFRWRYFCHFEGLEQVSGILFFLWGDEGDGCAFVPPSACSPYSVDVILEMVGALEVDNKDNRSNVQSPCADAGGDHDGLHSLLEIVYGELSVIGVHGPMQK